MSDWITVRDFSLQEDLAEVAAFIQRHQLPIRISEESNCQRVATPVAQLVQPMQQLLQRWQLGEIDLAQVSVHVYDDQSSMPDTGADVGPSVGTSGSAASTEGVSETSQPEPSAVIPQWSLRETPVSLLLIVLCFIGWFLLRQGLVEGLVIFPQQQGDFDLSRSTLAWHLSQGEYWRLWSPAMLHFSLPHALFNALGIWIVGRSLEARAGSVLFAVLVLLAAPAANITQYFWSPQILFGGMSGVVYALVGVAFVVQRWVPTWNDVPRSITWLAVAWLFICMTGLVDYFISGGVANAAHLGGFAAGLLLGVTFCVLGGAQRFSPGLPVESDGQSDHRSF